MTGRVWDCFPFFNELDLLECRLTELDDAVYRFVLVEATVTHQGQPKPLFYAENKDRFAAWADRIVHVVADLADAAGGADENWARENAQREAITRGLRGMRGEDVFLLSDVDEIPFPRLAGVAAGHVLCMRNHLLAVNLIDPGWWAGTVAVHGRDVPARLQDLREGRHQAPPLLDKRGHPATAGWHFSWLGGPAEMRVKAAAFAHAEDRGHVEADAEHMYAEKKCFAGAERHILETVIDATWPKYMQQRRGPKSWYWPGDGR